MYVCVCIIYIFILETLPPFHAQGVSSTDTIQPAPHPEHGLVSILHPVNAQWRMHSTTGATVVGRPRILFFF